MKKILFVINTLGRAGAETALIELLRRLNSKEYEIDLFVLTGQGEMLEKVPVHVNLLNRQYDDSSVLTRVGKKHLVSLVLRSFLSRLSGLRLIGYLWKNFVSIRKKKNLPWDKLFWRVISDGAERFSTQYDLAVAFLEGGASYYVSDHVVAKKKAAFLHVDYQMAGYNRSLDQDCYQTFDRVFCVSEEVRESFLLTYPECRDKTDIFHNLLDFDGIKQRSQEAGFTDSYEGYRILSVGRLTAQKSFDTSIEAMKLIKERGIFARWYILGEGELRPQLEKQIDRLGLKDDFLLLGAVSNPYPFYSQADLYVHASMFEGKSIAIQEAQILGCPIIVSDCSGNREQVIQEEDGILCEMSPQGICDAVCTLLAEEEKRHRLATAAAGKLRDEENDIHKLLELLGSEEE